MAFWESIDFYKSDFILGCETWLNHSFFDNEVLPEGYTVYWKDRIDGYGGVLIGIKKNFSSKIINVNTECKICAVKVKRSANF